MPRNEEHMIQAKPEAYEASRQRFVLALKQDLGRRLRSQIRDKVPSDILEKKDSNIIEDYLESMPERNIWGRLSRSAQELMWKSVAEPIFRKEESLKSFYNTCKSSSSTKGSIELNDNLQFPDEIFDTHVHVQPGGYFLNRSEDDIIAGALYEAGGEIYSQGQSIDVNESKAELVIRFLKEKIPNFNPIEILDMGCSAGASSTPYARIFPKANVYAIDIAPGLLRYAHSRAEALGVPVHFKQSDVGNTNFKDKSFDLIVSHNAMHEMSEKTVKNMMKECKRLVKDDGIVLHQDVPFRNSELDPYQQADFAWEFYYNNEPCWKVYADLDVLSLMHEADLNAQCDRVQQLGGSMNWDLFWTKH